VTAPSALEPPEAELAGRLLQRVAFRDRLPAGRLRPPVGIIPGDIRSLSSLFLHLAPQPNSLPGVNLQRLTDWVRDVLGDAALADAIRSEVQASQSHVEGCLRVYELVAVRLAQAEAVTPGASPVHAVEASAEEGTP
jgi:hypothetical protein